MQIARKLLLEVFRKKLPPDEQVRFLKANNSLIYIQVRLTRKLWHILLFQLPNRWQKPVAKNRFSRGDKRSIGKSNLRVFF